MTQNISRHSCLCAFSFSLICGLTACVQFKARPLTAEGSAAAYAGRSLNDPGLQQFMAEQKAMGGTWEVNKLALVAAYYNPDVRVARALAAESAATIITAGQRPNPVLTFVPAYSPSLGKGIYPFNFQPTLSVTFETAGKRGKRLAQARADAAAAQFRVAAAAWDARTRVRTALLALYAGRQNAELLKTEAALHDEALKKLQVQVEEGEAPALDLTVARLALNRAKLAQHDAERQTATAREQLAGAVGVSPEALDAVRLDFSAFENLTTVPAATARRTALLHRNDLLALLGDYSVAEAMLRLEIAKQYPDIRINPTDQYDHSGNRWGVGISLDLPILNQNRGPIAVADAKRKTAGERFEARQAAVITEVGSALAAYQTMSAKAATARKLADEAAHASETTKKMVDAGELIPLDFVRRKIEASASNVALLTARIEAQTAAGQLEAALQMPLRHVK
jgi:cobalt-zinc-cadmium efflux system outer membrane protein